MPIVNKDFIKGFVVGFTTGVIIIAGSTVYYVTDVFCRTNKDPKKT